MATKKKPLALKYRAPKVQLEAEARAREHGLSPQQLYWDPRYKSYFYAGELQSEPFSAATGRTTSVVVEPSPLSPDAAYERRASILITGDRPRSRRSRRSISWSVGQADVSEPPTHGEEQGCCRWLPVVICAAAALLTVIVVVTIWVLLLLDNSGKRATTPRPEFTGQYFDDHGRQLGDEESGGNSPPNARFTNDSSTTALPDTQETSRRPELRVGNLKPSSDICLYTHKDDDRDGSEANGTADHPWQEHHAARYCDVRLHCCYSLQEDMSLIEDRSLRRDRRAAPRHGGSAEQSSSLIQLAVVHAKYANFRKLLTKGNGTLAAFIHNALALGRARGYLGFRVSLGEFKSSEIVPALIHAVRDIAGGLRRRNLTFGFFLPYGEPTKPMYVKRLGSLQKALAAPHSLILYPTASILMNKGVSPPVGVTASVPTTPPIASVCYLFYSAPAILLVFGNSTRCDVTATEPVSEVASPRLRSMASLCRSWKPSWNVSLHLYHGYACTGEREGAVFQTPLQASKFRHALLARTHSSCFGFLDDEREVLRACKRLTNVLRNS